MQKFSVNIEVKRDTDIILEELNCYDKIMLSPGPGLPENHPIMLDVIEKYGLEKSILGICLGCQAIAVHFGARLRNLREVRHGISSTINVLKRDSIFLGIPKKIDVGHYHSWVIDEDNFPDCLVITSKNEDGFITSFTHKKYELRGVQFHPESILTEYGLKMIENWLFN